MRKYIEVFDIRYAPKNAVQVQTGCVFCLCAGGYNPVYCVLLEYNIFVIIIFLWLQYKKTC